MKILLKNMHKYGGDYHKAGSVVDWPDEIASKLVKNGSATAKLSAPQAESVEVPSIDLEQKEKKKK